METGGGFSPRFSLDQTRQVQYLVHFIQPQPLSFRYSRIRRFPPDQFQCRRFHVTIAQAVDPAIGGGHLQRGHPIPLPQRVGRFQIALECLSGRTLQQQVPGIDPSAHCKQVCLTPRSQCIQGIPYAVRKWGHTAKRRCNDRSPAPEQDMMSLVPPGRQNAPCRCGRQVTHITGEVCHIPHRTHGLVQPDKTGRYIHIPIQ